MNLRLPLVPLAMITLASLSTVQGQPIGFWTEDREQLPVYSLAAPLPIETKDAEGRVYPMRNDPIFLLGNNRLTLFVHGSGIMQFVSGERAWARLNAAGKSYGSNHAAVVTRSERGETRHELVGLESLAADPTRCTRSFGTGYAVFRYHLPEQITVERRVDVRASAQVNQGQPGCVVSVVLKNDSSVEQAVEYSESVDARYESMNDRGRDPQARLVKYRGKVSFFSSGGGLRAEFIPGSEDPMALRAPSLSSRYDARPPDLLLLPVSGTPSVRAAFYTEPTVNDGHTLGAKITLNLKPGEEQTVRFVVGLAVKGDATPIADLSMWASSPRFLEEARQEWAAKIPPFTKAPDQATRREMKWHAYTLQAMATYSEYYQETYIPQGQTYDYEMDLTAAPRDHLQHNLPLSYFAPDLARSNLRFVLKKMTTQGEIPYTAYGYGRTSNSAWNTSDQQLYLFLAIADYLRVTQDYGFLNDQSEYSPLAARFPSSTLDKLENAFIYLRDEVGTGPHGLVRLMNSDWSDMIYSDTSVFAYFWTAESHMNSAMVLAVVPELIRQLESAANSGTVQEAARARLLARGMGHYLEKIRKAFYQDLGERSFSRRLYFNASSAWGDDNMHIEPQSFLLMAEDFPGDRKKALWQEVKNRILKNEPLGPRQRETPIAVAKYDAGTGENGGVWFALVGPMIVGVNTFDREEAWGLLRRISLENFARQYPHCWVGQWTSAECFNSVVTGPIAGLPRTGDDWTWTSFPVFCAHAHAWPLYGYLRIMGDTL